MFICYLLFVIIIPTYIYLHRCEHVRSGELPVTENLSDPFLFPDDIFDYEGLEYWQVPHVDKEKTKTAASKEDAGILGEILEGLIVHPENDEDSYEESENVHIRIDDELQGVVVLLADDVEDPGLVSHSVQLGDQGEDCEPNRRFR